MNKPQHCPEQLPQEMRTLVSQLGAIWKQSPPRPVFSDEIVGAWKVVIKSWLDDKSMPLFIRKSSGVRGSVTTHRDGRQIIVCDNSPAQWVCYHCLVGKALNIEEIKTRLDEDDLPVAFVHKKKETDLRSRHCTLGKFSINNYGWKLCHIQPVGLGSSIELGELPMDDLAKAFCRLIDPSNFLLIPKGWGGLGEVSEFLDAFKNPHKHFT
jgi:hypothetical protein